VLNISVYEVIDQVLRQGLMSPFESQTAQLLNLAGEQEYETFAAATLIAQRLEGKIAELHGLHAANLVVAPDVGLIDAQPVSLNGPGISGFAWMLRVEELRDGKWAVRTLPVMVRYWEAKAVKTEIS
jgi:hypothetical protein